MHLNIFFTILHKKNKQKTKKSKYSYCVVKLLQDRLITRIHKSTIPGHDNSAGKSNVKNTAQVHLEYFII